MADRSKKEPTPPPLLLMPAGGGLTLTPPDQENVLMPVIQSEASLFGPEDEALGEVDSFVGQSPPSSHSATPQLPLSSSGLFQGSTVSSSDPFSQVGQGPPVGPPNTVNPPRPPPVIPGASSISQTASYPPVAPPLASVPPMPTASGLSNLYRKHGSNRYAQMPAGTYAPSPSTLMSSAPAPIPFSQNFSEAATLEPTPTSSFTTIEPGPPSTQPPPASLGPMPGMGYVTGATGIYVPVSYHWCYCKNVEGRDIWYPFSMSDNLALEDGLKEVNLQGGSEVVVSTDGGRYDVNINERLRYAIYWEEEPVVVKRCSWFYKREGDNRYVPYDEDLCMKLEDEYRTAINTGVWHKRLEFSGGETIVMHNLGVMVHFQPSSHPDEWGTLQVSTPQMVQGDQMRPRVVKRGVSDFESIDEGESRQIDHLVFVVHGIGSICDIRFRSIVECVDDFRSISQSLLKSHFTQYVDSSRIGRVEYLPIHWHKALHGDATGIDRCGEGVVYLKSPGHPNDIGLCLGKACYPFSRQLKAITLPSTAKLRHFVNDTLMDVLFYTSPTYCQWIVETVGSEMNRLYSLFLSRNPQFVGAVSVAGHSLGSCILFDLLQHQGDQHVEETHTESETMINGHPEPPIESDLGQAEVEGVNEEEKEEDRVLTLEELLSKVGLQEKKTLFEQEQIDMESLIMCSESDLKDLGLPMGPRKKLQGLLKEEQNKKDKKKLDAEKRVREEEERKLREKLTRELAAQGKSSVQMNSKGRPSGSESATYLVGPAGTGQPEVHYPKLDFSPICCFSFGSPIGLFLSARGMEVIGEDFTLPTCQKFFNIFHPFDPVAYRLEPLINPHAGSVKPVLMPHHKGRKRLHLELKESLAKVGADIKQKIIDSIKSTWNSINDFAKAHKDGRTLEQQVDNEMSSVVQQMVDDEHSDTASVLSNVDEDLYVGQLNEGRRIDYVLQERPIESFNDYMFSLTSHGCYWNSEDTVLLVLKEIYSLYGLAPTLPGSDSSHKQPIGPPPRMNQPNLASYNTNQSAQPTYPSQVISQPLQPPSGYSERPPPPQGPQQYSMVPPVGNPPSFSRGPAQINMGPPQTQPGANVGPPPMMGFVRATPKS